jgi:Protein of unknown function (DUF1800)
LNAPHRGWPAYRLGAAALALTLAALSGCGGGKDTPVADAVPGSTTSSSSSSSSGTSGAAAAATSVADAARLALQASFGPSEALIDQMRSGGAAAWVASQMRTTGSVYRSGGSDIVHRQGHEDLCSLPAYAGPNCWRDYYSTQPTLWDFYRNAMTQPDQLRQRVAFALGQIAVVSNREVHGTYGYRVYHNRLLELAFGNYREVLRAVTLSPLMGDYLNNVNNHRNAPNENYARELLQLFAIGTCELASDGRLLGGSCRATYNNETVRNYAYALTGWTYPSGGSNSGGCWPSGTHCRHYGGDMVPLPAFHDTQSRKLLSGVTVPANSTPQQALDLVLDSLMQHPSMAPFVGRQLIQHLVGSNPSAAYVQRVSEAFVNGRFSADGHSFGEGRRGDLAATLAAVLLDAEARGATPHAQGGKLREPVLMFTGVLRALNGRTDGDALGWWWGDELAQMVFFAPSVFNFYPPDYPVAGTSLVGPAFGIHNAGTAVARMNFLTYLIYWGGSAASTGIPGAEGTRIDIQPFASDASDPARLVDRLSVVAFGEALPAAQRSLVIDAVTAVNNSNTAAADVAVERARQAAFLVFASPRFHVQR